MKHYQLANNLLGWLIFAVAAFTYCSTVEPTASFWDCPEFITTAYKLEVGHPPGAPFFMLTANFFTQFTDDPTQVAFCVNIMSALLSAFCILFLFWSVTHLARKLICEGGVVRTPAEMLLVLGSGVCGALVYTWSDTFWFSAVEGEVYAYSSMFTALVFWLILKWEDVADEPGSDRWLVLIFYLTGLSIGVHLLNLLCLPAIVLVYYFRKYPTANTKGSLAALAVSGLLVAAVLYGVVPGIVKVGGWFELFFVNTVGLGFNSGMVIYIVVLIAIVLAAIWSTTRKNRTLINILYTLSVALLGIPFYGHGYTSLLIGIVVIALLYYFLRFRKADGEYLLRKRLLNTSLLCMLMLMIGYSSYAVIVIRSTQNTPMDQSSPEDVFTLGEYLSREQYGSRPLFYGEAFTSQPYDLSKEKHIQRHEKVSADEPDRYDEVERNGHYVFPDQMKMLFPRIYDSGRAEAYEQWLGGVDKHDVEFTIPEPNGGESGPYIGEMPSQIDNIRFFLSYQVNFMYWRYFMWNFAGRQNDIQGNGEAEHGNWITGIPVIDNYLYGDQSKLPDELKENKGRNVFYCLPLLLGLLGLFWQAYKGDRGVRQFWIVFFLFFMTGLAIVLYLNQTPQQPRERDYAYAGSFYAFAIWVGLGVAAIADLLGKLRNKAGQAIVKPMPAAWVASLIGLLVPLQMVSQTWDDHDRSNRYACRDFGLNYLNTLPEGNYPIIFTNGDNDTFPLWYAQDTEGNRTDARVCNLSYLQTDWYTDQMRRQAWKSPGLPISWNRYEYVDNVGHDWFRIYPDKRAELDEIKQQNPAVDPYELTYIIDNYVRKRGYIPTDSITIRVNAGNVRAQGTTIPRDSDGNELPIPDHITLSLKGKSSVSKCDMMIYEMLARNDWKRPIYMSVTLGPSNYAGLDKFCTLEGLAYRITPFEGGLGKVDADKMLDNLLHRFKYGNVSAPGVYLDETVMRMCQTHRRMFALVVEQLLLQGRKDDALKALKKCKQELSPANIPYEASDLELASYWYEAGDSKEAARVASRIGLSAYQYLAWASTLRSSTMENYAANCIRSFKALALALNLLEEAAPKSQETVRLQRLYQQAYDLDAGRFILYYLQQQQGQYPYEGAMSAGEPAASEDYAAGVPAVPGSYGSGLPGAVEE